LTDARGTHRGEKIFPGFKGSSLETAHLEKGFRQEKSLSKSNRGGGVLGAIVEQRVLLGKKKKPIHEDVFPLG